MMWFITSIVSALSVDKFFGLKPTLFTLCLTNESWKMLDILVEKNVLNKETSFDSPDQYGMSIKDYLFDQYQLNLNKNELNKSNCVKYAPKFCKMFDLFQ